jgi:ribosome modulation factor
MPNQSSVPFSRLREMIVFTEGVKAFTAGLQRNACPYAGNDQPAHLAWQDGWIVAETRFSPSGHSPV